MITKSPQETENLAQEIAQKIKNGGILCLYGDLGAGKTTFAKALGQALGIDKFSIKSPTYTYIRRYLDNIYHLDLYRLEAIDELLAQEIDELFQNTSNIIIIEWADRLKDNLPAKRLDIKLEYVDENSRKITIDDHS